MSANAERAEHDCAQTVLHIAADEIAALPGITAVMPTVLALMRAPHAEPALPQALAAASAALDGPVERILIVAADAIGLAQGTRCPDILAPVAQQAPHPVTLRAMSPSVTPVCYASMFSGVTPEIHGIHTYEKPVLTVNTLFDLLPAAGKRVAIAAVAESSIDRIFRDRPIAYFSESDDAQVTARALELLATDACDCLVVYLSAYDDALHRSTPWSSDALAAMRDVVNHFTHLGEALDTCPWRHHPRALLFAPDHGAHTDAQGKGTHGSDLADDLVVRHYFSFRPPAK